MTDDRCDHFQAKRRAEGRRTNLSRCYLDALHDVDKWFGLYRKQADEAERLQREVDRLRAASLPRIDPEMIPAGCALPAFDGVEEAQMALRRAGAAL
jgi:hypothetical protein